MKIYTNKNNTSTLKLLIAAKLAGKKVELIDATFEEDIFTGPRQLPLLSVDDQLSFFSSNTAVQYLFPILDLSKNGQCQQIQEWEATQLHPAVSAVLYWKAESADLNQAVDSMLQVIDRMLQKHQYILGGKLSAADISVWSTLYPLYFDENLNSEYMEEYDNICRWVDEISSAKAVKEAVKQWGGSAEGPFGASSALGIPQVTSLVSPIGSPDEDSELGTCAEEVEIAKELWENGLKEMQAPIKQEKVVLPVKGRKNVLITSALPYVNNVPHLGNIIGCVLSADIFARYCRMCDYNTLYICGTDEYGTATETKALEEGVTPKEICDKYFEIHNSVYRWFNIGFDYFGRTSTKEQTEISQKMFLKLKDNGFISSMTVDQLLCEKCDRFLADRFVEGICPHPRCLYDSARGDQCDKCGKLINAIELGEPRCKVCGHKPIVKQSQQLFIELPELEPAIRTWVSSQEQNWSPSARAVTRSWLREPLRARAVTRDLKWGVQVPVPGFENKVFYVWFDAPIGYLSITQAATKQYEKWWKPDKEYDVKLYQFMAKDNVPFHAIMFPATLLGVNEGHILVNHLYATEYLNYEEGKFSKSRGVGVFGTDAQETGIPSDVWRFYLASIRPETSDSSFSWLELGTRNNSELLNNLGNFCHRSLSFCASVFKSRVPDITLSATDGILLAFINRDLFAYVHYMEKGCLREALRYVMKISRYGNQHMQSEQPWVLLKGSEDDKNRGATAIGICCQLVALLCALLTPFIPDACRKLREQLNIGASVLRINPLKPSCVQYLPSGHLIGKPEPLFTKIEQHTLDQLRVKYAGTQTERVKKQNGESSTASGQSIADLEAAIAQQGDKVRQIKSTTKDKTIWQPEVDKLLHLKKKLTAAQARAKTQATPAAGAQLTGGASIESLEKAIAEQGDKVRQIKSTTKDKAVWQPEVDKLLDLKKKLTAAQAQANTQATSDAQANTPSTSAAQANTHATSAAQANTPTAQSNTQASTAAQANTPATSAALANTQATPVAQAKTQATPAAQTNTQVTPVAPAKTQATPAAQAETPAAQANTQATPLAQVNTQATPAAQAKTQATPSAQVNTQAIPAAQANTQATPAAQANTQATPSAQVNPQATPAAQAKTQATPSAQVNTQAIPAAQANTQATPAAGAKSSADIESLEKAIAKQGEKVRQLKSSTKDKSVWQQEGSKLLELKKQLVAAQAQKPRDAQPVATAGDSAESLQKAIAEQGEKVRKLKASTNDKTVWQPEVNVLLDLKKRLAALQLN